ncbi:MAG: hypothetical protein QY323_02950 [Patescibacteria group bacterium]|nr:MAG: hypothetical protein QY323_02950 [Patescibacteria group bacterium]
MIFFLFDDKTEPADIFAEIPSEKAPASPPQGLPTAPPSVTAAPGVTLEQSSLGHKWILIAVLAVVLIGGSATAYFALRGGTPPSVPESGVPMPEPAPQPQPEPPQPEPQPEPPQPEPQPQPEPEVDTDGDGLNDAREAQIGTNAGMVDTDGDGLSDREEVEVYVTDPVNADTDGDTYSDGDEVRNGYDPKGPGKLLQIPPAP